jgi:PII-like signaling protein
LTSSITRAQTDWSLSEDLPVVAIVDRRDRVAAVLDDLQTTEPPGLVTLERARLLRGESAP